MNPADLLRRYYVAVVRTQYGHRCIGWTLDEITESFALCSDPLIGIDEWTKAMGYKAELGNDDISSKIMEEHNRNTMNGITSTEMVQVDG